MKSNRLLSVIGIFALLTLILMLVLAPPKAFGETTESLQTSDISEEVIPVELNHKPLKKALANCKKVYNKIGRLCGYLKKGEAKKQYKVLTKKVKRVKKLAKKHEEFNVYSKKAVKMQKVSKRRIANVDKALARQRAAASRLEFEGVVYSGGWRYTWYSQNVLPGGGLSIPGRHVGNAGLIMDKYNRVCVASSSHAKGTVLNTPYGKAKVYDSGCDYGTIDIYTNW